jgi:DNA polymerase-3 subunit delta
MKIKAEELARSLKAGNSNLVWLSGDEPLLMQEAADQARAHFRKQGFSERDIFSIDRNFDWQLFKQATGNLSLFSERKLLDLRLSGKLEDDGKAALQEFIDDANPDFAVLLSGPRLEAATLKTKWFKALESGAVVVQIWPINKDGLPSWLEQRLLRAGIQAEPDALQLLIDRVEGNLLAAVQEIEKLKLLANSEDGGSIRLDARTVMQVVADSSRYTAFQLVDAALSGDTVRVEKILQGLRAEDVFPLVILGAITRELRSLLPMLEKKEAGQGVNAILQSHHVWFNRKQAVGAALNRLRSADIWAMLDHSRLIDQSIKGLSAANPWDELSLLLLRLAGTRVASARA